MVARENAEAAGGDGQGFVETKLRRKIRHGIFVQMHRVFAAPSVLIVEIFLKIRQHRPHAIGEFGILQMHAQLVFGNFAQHRHGIVKKILPTARRELLE